MKNFAENTAWANMPTGVYLGGFPSPEFAFTRSYAAQLGFYGDSTDIDQSGDTFTVWLDRPTGYGIVYVLNDFIQPWSSNRYTLDFVVADCWWIYNFDGFHHPQAFTVNYWWRGFPLRPTISLIQPSAGSLETFIPLPHSPVDYWLPPVL